MKKNLRIIGDVVGTHRKGAVIPAWLLDTARPLGLNPDVPGPELDRLLKLHVVEETDDDLREAGPVEAPKAA